MKKEIKRVIAIVLLMSLSISMTACGNTNDETNTKQSTSYYIDYEPEDVVYTIEHYDEDEENDCRLLVGKHEFTKELLDTIYNHKNHDIEIEIKDYTTNELHEELLKTYVKVSWAKGREYSNGSGSIYDIDDKYVYIVTALHCLNYGEDITIENVGIKLMDNKLIKPIEIIYNDNFGDMALIIIKKDDVDTNTLPLLKSINTKNIFQYNNSEIDVYGTLYNYNEKNFCYYTGKTVKPTQIYNSSMMLQESNLIPGNSGGGLFDKYGNYYGLIHSVNMATSHWYMYLYNEIVNFNPEYGNLIDIDSYYTKLTPECS